MVALAGVLIGLTGHGPGAPVRRPVIYGMYGFHINGFVVDLVFSPGGIASLGASRSTELTAALIGLALLAVQAASYFWVDVALPSSVRRAGCRGRAGCCLASLALTVGERARLWLQRRHQLPADPVCQRALPLLSADDLPQVGGPPGHRQHRGETPRASYQHSTELPACPAARRSAGAAAEHRLAGRRVVALRSARPFDHAQSVEFSKQALRLEQHYSGGNVTQMGIFSMFYGLYGNYWFPMIKAAGRRS
jgi:hypothetical protein